MQKKTLDQFQGLPVRGWAVSASFFHSCQDSAQNAATVLWKPKLHSETPERLQLTSSLSSRLPASCQLPALWGSRLGHHSSRTFRQLQSEAPFNNCAKKPKQGLPSWGQPTQQLWEVIIYRCFKSLHSGVICYVATESQNLLEDRGRNTSQKQWPQCRRQCPEFSSHHSSPKETSFCLF